MKFRGKTEVLFWRLGVHFERLDRCHQPTILFLVEEFCPYRERLRRCETEHSSLATRKQRVQGMVRLRNDGFCTGNRKLWHVEVLQLLASLR